MYVCMRKERERERDKHIPASPCWLCKARQLLLVLGQHYLLPKHPKHYGLISSMQFRIKQTTIFPQVSKPKAIALQHEALEHQTKGSSGPPVLCKHWNMKHSINGVGAMT